MKVVAKSVTLVGIVAVAALAVSASPSEAAKRRMHAKCDVSRACAANCNANTCELRRCEADGKTYVTLPFLSCAKGTTCPPPC